MMQLSIKNVADNADMIINGYAFTRDGNYIRVLNLNRLNNAAVIYKDEIVETNMDDIEMAAVSEYGVLWGVRLMSSSWNVWAVSRI